MALRHAASAGDFLHDGRRYLIALSATFAQTGAWGFSYPVLFLVGLAIRLRSFGPIAYGDAVFAAYVVGMIGLSRSMRTWPWLHLSETQATMKLENAAVPNDQALGWPFDRLGPWKEPEPKGKSRLDPILALPTGRLVGVLSGLADLGSRCEVLPLANGIAYIGVIFAASRLGLYITGYAPPLSLGGRITRLRFIVPSYDQVFLAPIAGVLASSVGPAVLTNIGTPLDLACPISLTLCLLAIWVGRARSESAGNSRPSIGSLRPFPRRRGSCRSGRTRPLYAVGALPPADAEGAARPRLLASVKPVHLASKPPAAAAITCGNPLASAVKIISRAHSKVDSSYFAGRTPRRTRN